jgi:hypothetical protein
LFQKPLINTLQIGTSETDETFRRLVKTMIAKAWMALAFGAALMVGGITSVAALGNMYGDCDTERLQDGTGDNCTCSTDVTEEDDSTCDSCNDYLWDFSYESPGPHSSAVGQQ